jgi:hypothetical protein
MAFSRMCIACRLGRKGVVGKRLGILLKVTEFE